MQPDPYQNSSRTKVIWIVIGAVAALGLLTLGVVGVLALTGKGSGPVANVDGKGGQPTLPINGLGGPSVTNVEGAAPPPVLPKEAKRMPKDILDWLEHLRICEESKVKITNDSFNELLPMAAMSSLPGIENALKGAMDPDAEEPQVQEGVKGEDTTQRIATAFQQLADYFASKPAPPECLQIATNYSAHINGLRQHVLAFAQIFGSLKDGLSSEQAKSMGRQVTALDHDQKEFVDKPGNETERLLSQLCAAYETPMWFHIEGNVSNSGADAVVGGLKGLLPQ